LGEGVAIVEGREKKGMRVARRDDGGQPIGSFCDAKKEMA